MERWVIMSPCPTVRERSTAEGGLSSAAPWRSAAPRRRFVRLAAPLRTHLRASTLPGTRGLRGRSRRAQSGGKPPHSKARFARARRRVLAIKPSRSAQADARAFAALACGQLEQTHPPSRPRPAVGWSRRTRLRGPGLPGPLWIAAPWRRFLRSQPYSRTRAARRAVALLAATRPGLRYNLRSTRGACLTPLQRC